MTRGFYSLGSSMLTQNRTLGVVSNNIANLETPGFKKDTILSTTFGEMVMNRVNGGEKTPLGSVSLMRRADSSATMHTQGMLKAGDRVLDFALTGEGFFGVKTKDAKGEDTTMYTRNGSFNIDKDGFLVMPGVGRVQSDKGGDIKLGTDKFTCNERGELYGTDGKLLGTIGRSTFEDYGTVLTVGNGMYSGENPIPANDSAVKWKSLEGSNVDMSQEMTVAMATQRVLQSVSQAMKMYDLTMQTATTAIGKV